MALKLIRRGPEVVTSNPISGTGLSTATGAWGTYFKSPGDGVVRISVTGDVDQICVWIRDFSGANVQTFRARRGTESFEQCHLVAAVPLAKNQPWFVQAEGQGKTVTIMHERIPIPPPYSIAGFLRRLVGGCRGADKNRPDTGGLRQRLVCTQGRRTGGAANSWAGLVRQGITARGVLPSGADVCAGVGTVNHVGVHTSRRSDLYGGTDRAGLHRQGVRNRHLPHHLAPQGVSC